MHLSTFAELSDLMSKLHDAPFDFDRSLFDKSHKTWTGTFLRPLWDDPRAERRGFPILYVRTRLPVAEVTLTIVGVENVEIVDDQGIGRYTFDEIERSTDELRLIFNQAMQIHLLVPGAIEATYDEQPLPGLWATYSELFLLVQSGPKLETSSK